jgi:hypothetical protein
MPGYSVATNTSFTAAAAAGAAFCTFHGNLTRRVRIYEIDVSIESAPLQCDLGLTFPNNTPVATTSILNQPLDPADAAGTANFDIAWSTAPTVSSPVFRGSVTLGPAIGSDFTFVFPDSAPLILGTTVATGWLLFWNIGAATGPKLNVTIRSSE